MHAIEEGCYGEFAVQSATGGWRVKFRFSSERLAAIKAIGGRNYDPSEKSWFVPSAAEAALWALIQPSAQGRQFTLFDDLAGSHIPRVGSTYQAYGVGEPHRVTSVRCGGLAHDIDAFEPEYVWHVVGIPLNQAGRA